MRVAYMQRSITSVQLAFFLRQVKTAIGTTARYSMWNLTSWLKEKDAAVLDMHEPLLKSDGRYRQSILLQVQSRLLA